MRSQTFPGYCANAHSVVRLICGPLEPILAANETTHRMLVVASTTTMVGNVRNRTFLILFFRFLYLMFCCVRCILKKMMFYFLSSTALYRLFLLLLLSAKWEDDSEGDKKVKINRIWLMWLIGIIISLCSGISAFVLVQLHLTAKRAGKEVETLQQTLLLPQHPPLF